MHVKICHRRGYQSRTRDAKIDGHVSSQLDELVATALLTFPRSLAPEGSYEQRLHQLDRPVSTTDDLIADDVHGFFHELVVYIGISALSLLGDSVDEYGEKQDWRFCA